MKNNNNFLLTETQTDFIRNSLSEFKSKPSTHNVKKPQRYHKQKEKEMMLTFLLGEDIPNKNNNTLSIRKRSLLQRDFHILSPINNTRHTSRNGYVNNNNNHIECTYLPSINSVNIVNRSNSHIDSNSNNKNNYVPYSVSYIAFPRINKSVERKGNVSSLNTSRNHINNIIVTNTTPQESTLNTIVKHNKSKSKSNSNSQNHKQRNNNSNNKVNHVKNIKTEPTLIMPKKQKHKRSFNFKHRLQHPKITYLHNLHQQLQRRSKKRNPTIFFGNYFTDIYDRNAKLPPSDVKIDSSISRTYENPNYKTPSSSFVLSDIFNFKGFCIYGICEGNITSPKAALISSIARECLSTHLTDPMAYNLKSCSSIAGVLDVLTDNNFELIKNAFTSTKDELAQVNIKDELSSILNVMLLILIHNEIIVCALGSFTKGYWFGFEEDAKGKEIMNSYKIINNEEKELYIERINYNKRMKFVIAGSRLFWEKMVLYNVMKIIYNNSQNLNEVVDKIYEYKRLVLKRKEDDGNEEEGVYEEDVVKYLLYSIIVLKF